MEVGSKVMCVKHTTGMLGLSIQGHTIPVIGKEYTIRGFSITASKVRACRLCEIINPPDYYTEGYVECAFDVEAFVEVQRPIGSRIEDVFGKEIKW